VSPTLQTIPVKTDKELLA